ncbi:MAG TPA: NAD(P)-dependent oxidoreductase [Rhizomicrobium sp.]
MKRTLVTGASGLIGRHVAEALAQRGFEVHGCSRAPARTPAISMHQCDLLDSRATELLLREIRPDTIVHCAWVTTHGTYWQSPQNLEWLSAGVLLLRAARDAGMSRFVGVGSCAEYEAAGDMARHESRSPIAPTTLYGSAKDALRLAAEKTAAEQGFQYAWARVFMLYGAGEHPDRFIASLARAIVSGQPALMSSGTIVRDYLDARDVGTAIAMLAASPLAGVVNIASGHGITLRAVGEKLAKIAGRPDLLVPGALPPRAGEPQTLVADVGRLRDELGFRPSIALDRGLADVLDYWRVPGSA